MGIMTIGKRGTSWH